MHDPQHVVEQGGGGDFGAGARPADHQGLLAVAAAGDGHQVVGARARAQRVRGRQRLQPHARASGIEAADETEPGPLARSLGQAGAQRRVQHRQQPELSRVSSVEKSAPIENEFDPLSFAGSDDDAARNQRLTSVMRGVARQISMDPGDGMEL